MQRIRFDGVAVQVFSVQHSEFGHIVFTRDLDGISPFLHPTEPIPRDHIIRAAKRAGVPADEIDVMVCSLSEFLGWDIEKGSAAE